MIIKGCRPISLYSIEMIMWHYQSVGFVVFMFELLFVCLILSNKIAMLSKLYCLRVYIHKVSKTVVCWPEEVFDTHQHHVYCMCVLPPVSCIYEFTRYTQRTHAVTTANLRRLVPKWKLDRTMSCIVNIYRFWLRCIELFRHYICYLLVTLCNQKGWF